MVFAGGNLAQCVRAYLCRNTIGAGLLPGQRLNHYPASLTCAITWMIHGSTELVVDADLANTSEAPSRIVFSGPSSRPFTTYNPSEVHFFVLLLLPDAVQMLTGMDVPAWVDRHGPVADVMDAAWTAMADQVLHAQSDAQRVQLIEAFLAPQWAQLKQPAAHPGQLMADWLRVITARALTSGAGQSLRQAERRVKLWAGQTMRQLRRIGRAETSFLIARRAHRNGSMKWSDFAAERGFSDQSHLGREVRKLSGLSPEELMRAIDTDEAFWLYRIWN